MCRAEKKCKNLQKKLLPIYLQVVTNKNTPKFLCVTSKAMVGTIRKIPTSLDGMKTTRIPQWRVRIFQVPNERYFGVKEEEEGRFLNSRNTEVG